MPKMQYLIFGELNIKIESKETFKMTNLNVSLEFEGRSVFYKYNTTK